MYYTQVKVKTRQENQHKNCIKIVPRKVQRITKIAPGRRGRPTASLTERGQSPARPPAEHPHLAVIFSYLYDFAGEKQWVEDREEGCLTALLPSRNPEFRALIGCRLVPYGNSGSRESGGVLLPRTKQPWEQDKPSQRLYTRYREVYGPTIMETLLPLSWPVWWSKNLQLVILHTGSRAGHRLGSIFQCKGGNFVLWRQMVLMFPLRIYGFLGSF